MPELINDNSLLFNKDFLKFRKKYYIHETNEFLARHKLLTAFIICLLAPGMSYIQAIGVPFYAMIAPGFSLEMKLLFLTALLFFLMLLTNAQSKFIKGGTFRDYFDTFGIPPGVYKKMDTIILLLSLNVVWIAILLGAGKIYQLPAKPALLWSYYCLYCSMIIAMLALLLNSLYRNTAGVLLLVLSLILIAVVSTRDVCLLNMLTALVVGLLSAAIVLKVQPSRKKTKYLKIFDRKELKRLTIGSFPSVFFLTQLASYRANKSAFFIRISLCFFLSIISFKLFFADAFISNRTVLLVLLIGFESYILSTLFTFFAQDERDYAVFYAIFPYQSFRRRPIEIAMVGGILLLSAIPMVAFSVLIIPSGLLPLMVILAMNMIAITINRRLYAYSLRFCLFTSLLNMAANILAQYILIGAIFGH